MSVVIKSQADAMTAMRALVDAGAVTNSEATQLFGYMLRPLLFPREEWRTRPATDRRLVELGLRLDDEAIFASASQ